MHFATVFGRLVELCLSDRVGRERNGEPICQLFAFLAAEIFLLMNGVVSLCRWSKSIAFDGLGEDHARLAFDLQRLMERCVQLAAVMTAAADRPYLLVAERLHEVVQARGVFDPVLAHHVAW